MLALSAVAQDAEAWGCVAEALRAENAELRAQLSGEGKVVKESDHDALYDARRKQRCAEAALVAAKAEALAATMQAHRGKDVDVVAQLREELAACRRQLASREPGAPASWSRRDGPKKRSDAPRRTWDEVERDRNKSYGGMGRRR